MQKVGELIERKPLLCLGEFEYSPASGYYVSPTPAFLSKVLTVKPNTDLDLAKSLLCYPSSQCSAQWVILRGARLASECTLQTEIRCGQQIAVRDSQQSALPGKWASQVSSGLNRLQCGHRLLSVKCTIDCNNEKRIANCMTNTLWVYNYAKVKH